MKQQQTLLKLIYGYVSFAFTALCLDVFIHPIGEILAGVWLLFVCYYIGKYGNLPRSKK